MIRMVPYQSPEPYRSKYPNDPYAGEVRDTDAVIGKLLNNLKTQDSNNQIIAIFQVIMVKDWDNIRGNTFIVDLQLNYSCADDN